MATPSPRVLINVTHASLIDAHTLELAFEWPRGFAADAIAVDWLGAQKSDDGAWSVRVIVEENRTKRSVAVCVGPIEKQRLHVDLRTLLRRDMTVGILQLNDAGLYGIMKTLPSFDVEFDLR